MRIILWTWGVSTMKVPRFYLLALLLALCNCTAGSSGGSVPGVDGSAFGLAPHERRHPIQHVVLIVQENRTVDDLFQFFPGANTANTCTGPNGTVYNLVSKTLQDPTGP